MTQRTIKPAEPGLVVRRPENGKPLAAQGEPVEWSAYWQRRLNEGDVVDASAVPNTAQATQEQPKAEQLPAAADKKGGAK
ncbi:DUF2635 domain-containing protein [Stutzerimonas nitrititolerans]|uniref:DUF2635 domain-containing protein n=1 Tax=Stutzerimonas nitrititolerans TaxID=2482751 RepID=UPI0028AD84CB|nr:DUF2635 domain-containing protein [Stutzerimonas nitrititolerans]